MLTITFGYKYKKFVERHRRVIKTTHINNVGSENFLGWHKARVRTKNARLTLKEEFIGTSIIKNRNFLRLHLFLGWMYSQYFGIDSFVQVQRI